MRISRVIAIIIGAVLTAVGLLTVFSMGAALALVGFDNKLDTGDTEFRTKTAAIAAEADGLGKDADRGWGSDDKANVKVQARSDQELFIGVGPTDKVKEYLDQAPWDEVDTFGAGTFATKSDDIDYEREGRSGSVRDLPAPGSESFWTTSKTGTDVTLDWDFDRNDHTIVLMNADGSPSVRADGSVVLRIPRLSWALVAGVVFGLVLLIVGLVLLFKVGRRRGSPQAMPYPVGGTPTPSPT